MRAARPVRNVMKYKRTNDASTLAEFALDKNGLNRNV
jgi:hypothetical protein